MENAIEVKNLEKSFRVYFDKGSQLKERMLFRSRNKHEDRKVLKGISFAVKKGEAIGLVGHNGCGKSTTLKLLAKIIYPDSGSVKVNGRVSSLIELGAGFHPDMTGRENIYTNAAIFGLAKKEINRRLADIIRFSELEDFIDNPVRTYSSGMYMRLAFSVAINVDADVLLIDEILAVGDVNFQQKCFEKLKEIKRKGTTIVIVSHSLEQIEQICERSIWIEDGCIREEGVPKKVHANYLYSMEQDRIQRVEKEREETAASIEEIPQVFEEKNDIPEDTQEDLSLDMTVDAPVDVAVDISLVKDELPSFCESYAVRMGNKRAEFINVEIQDDEGNEKYSFLAGETINFVMSYKTSVPGLEGKFGFGLFRDDGVYCYGTNTDIEYDYMVSMNEEGTVRVRIEKMPLMYGKYTLDVAIHSRDGVEIYDDIRFVKEFIVVRDSRDQGLVRVATEWYDDEVKLARGK